MQLKPRNQYVLVKPVAMAERTVGGILLPEIAQETSQEAVVLAVGTGTKDVMGNIVPIQAKPGDRVLTARHGAIEFELNEDKVYLLEAEDVLAII